MTWLIKLLVGSKKARIVALVLGAILISFAAIGLWERGIRNQVLQEIETQNLNKEIETRDRVDEAIRNSPLEFGDAVRLLRERQSNK